MSADHWHYASDIHGGAEEHHRHYDDEREVARLRSQADGLREDLAAAETRIRELEEQLARDIRQLWTHIGNMPGGI